MSNAKFYDCLTRRIIELAALFHQSHFASFAYAPTSGSTVVIASYTYLVATKQAEGSTRHPSYFDSPSPQHLYRRITATAV